MNKLYKMVPETEPSIGARRGIQKKLPPAVKGSEPQPAIAVNTLGAKSLAGFTAKPQLWPNEVPITVSENPIKTATPSCAMSVFCLSVIARIVIIKRDVAKYWSKNNENVSEERVPVLASYGYVAKIPAVSNECIPFL